MPLQVYRARPRSINPPTAFVDQMTETIEYPHSSIFRQRTSTAEIVVVFGLFDSGDAVDQRDAFVDAFLDWTTDNPHAADPDSIVQVSRIEDDASYVAEWIAVANGSQPRVYYATRIGLEAYIGNT